MTYKETLFFIGKCLTISHEKGNLKIVSETITSQQVDWDSVVKVSTAHYVFPALYCNLKRAQLLPHLPEELVSYMEHITELNKERNLEILKQAKEINKLLIDHGITPIFLKGTGNLLEGLYEDVAERMIGDIDFLVSEDSFSKTVDLLKKEGYKKTTEKLENPIISKHYPRIFHEQKIAAVEIHIRIVKGALSKKFNYNTVKNSTIKKELYATLSFKDQLALTILAKQYNDDGFYYKTISLRNSYDVFLLSLKMNSTELKNKYDFFFKYLNPYLYLTSLFFNSTHVKYIKNRSAKTYVKTSLLKLKFPYFGRLHHLFFNTFIYLKIKANSLIRFVKNKEFRRYYIKKLVNS